MGAGGGETNERSTGVVERISGCKRGASVKVALQRAMSTDITVFGEVSAPYTLPLTKEGRVAEAIGVVRGETIMARTGKIRVVRSGGGETVVYEDARRMVRCRWGRRCTVERAGRA